ncbi:glycoside hydrolase family 2 protein [Labilibacter marinus]|uniref:glycoside hydrolase family 2 protein n=1 Tax=Labilibacter marinus TaxID=1477105 RepID=UPI00082ECD5F|nr:glycoside hydrolase family 2 TIM barrel-domain containing protein [Labilibacter marinus]
MKILLLCILCTLVSWVNAQTISKETHRISHNWEFVRQDLGGIWEAIRPVKAGRPETVPLWTKVELPHCFNAEDAVDPDVNYYQGPGWYRTQLKIENPYANGRTLLHFEGAGQKTEVYIGLNKVAYHVGGYDEWTVDITDFIKDALNEEGKIPLSIRCDNSRDLQMIPSDLSDFNIYGGLYRYVNLTYVPQCYIKQVHAKPSIQNKKGGHVNLKIDLQNKDEAELELLVEVNDPLGNTVYVTKLTTSSTQIEHNFDLKKITKWSDVNPALYSLNITSLNKSGGQTYTDKFGFRSFRFEKNGPFYLNEKRLLLRGTHRHEDHAGVAAAMTEEMIKTEMQLMKDMGVNFIRLGHYQQSRIVLNLCDSLGILVWEEIPWCRGGLGGDVYKIQAKRMLSNMINQHFNHPSIIIWGLGNENDWPGDYPEFDKEKIKDFMRELNDFSHELDAERKTGIRRCDFCKDIIDVYSPSIWAGWYRGKFIEYKEVSRKNMEAVDHFFHMEWGGSSHAGRHDENPDKGLELIQTGQGADERAGDASLIGGAARVSKDGNWSETYICNLFDWHLKEQINMPWLTGAAQWAFKDFSTPVRPENPIPYMNQKGVVQRDLTKKESYYIFQSYWTKDPMVHIYGHSWPVRWGDEGEDRLVKVYSNCDKVELFLNGESLGRKNRNTDVFPACGLYWNIKFKKGVNSLLAVGQIKGKEVKDELILTYQTTKWGKVSQMNIEEIDIDEEYSWLSVKALDENGILCLDANIQLEFSCVGDAILIQNLGTIAGSRKVQMCNGHAKIKVKRKGSNYALSVKSSGINSAVLLGGSKK